MKPERVLVFDKGGRSERIALLQEGRVPRDFLYGTDRLIKQGFDIKRLSSRVTYGGGLLNKLIHLKEQLLSRLTHLGLRAHVIKHYQYFFANSNVVISFTDGFSLTLGSYFRGIPKNKAPFLIGCFHGLSDLEFKTPRFMRWYTKSVIKRSLNRLDHLAFFGPADRDYAIDRFSIDKNSTSVIRFGVDIEFWRPRESSAADYFFAIGQDTNRDFKTLVSAAVDMPIRIHTPLTLKIPEEKNNVTLTEGSYQKIGLTDEDLKLLYQNSIAVVVPLKDVNQPTGYSVTLQAMACGKPVILSRIKGLWATDILRNEENCILVTPGDVEELTRAMQRLASDPELCVKLGNNARQTVLRYFSLDASADSTEKLVKLGLAASMKLGLQ